MNVIISGKSIDLTPAIKAFVERKIFNLGDVLSKKDSDLAQARVEVGLPSKHHKSGPVFYAEINFKIGRELLRAETSQADLYAARDKCRDEIERQLRKRKQRLQGAVRRPAKL